MKESPKHPLKHALDQLPMYAAPESSWEQISHTLREEDGRSLLQKALGRLPVYQAPPSVWKGIQRTLQASPRSQLWRMAAVFGGLLLVSFTAWMLFRPTSPHIIRTETEKALDKNLELQEIRKIYTGDTIVGDTVLDDSSSIQP